MLSGGFSLYMTLYNLDQRLIYSLVAGLDERVLPRKRSWPARYAEGARSDYFPTSPTEM